MILEQAVWKLAIETVDFNRVYFNVQLITICAVIKSKYAVEKVNMTISFYVEPQSPDNWFP